MLRQGRSLRWYRNHWVAGLLMSLGVASAAAAAPAPAASVTLTVAHSWEPEFLQRQVSFDQEFMRRHPDIKVELINTASLDKYITMAAGNVLPDIIYVHYSWADTLIRQGFLLDLSRYLAATPGFGLNDFFPVALSPFRQGGRLYGLAYDAGPVVIYYIPEVFNQRGVMPPSREWRLDDFLLAARKLTLDRNGDGQVDFWGIDRMWDGEIINAPILASFGARFLNDERTEVLDPPDRASQALAWWSDLVRQWQVAPGVGRGNQFPSGNAAMTFGGSWMLRRWERAGGFVADVGHVPAGPAGQFVTVAGSGYAITASSAHKDAAWTYLSEYLGREGMDYMWGQSGRGSPARRSAWPSFEAVWSGKNVKVFREALGYGIYAPIVPREVDQLVWQRLNRIISGQESPQAAVEAARQQARPLLAAWR